jgi:cobalamin biosynthesis protein CobD/CbiB
MDGGENMSLVQGMLSIAAQGIQAMQGLELLGFGLICLIPVVWFIIAILLCIWVYRDAESRGMGGALWLIIVLITGIIGLIIYLVVRKDKPAPTSTS